MQLRRLVTEEDAVSEVVAVILLVAITVILATVVASFALGLGQQTRTSPQTAFTWEYERSVGNATIMHDGGDTIKERQLFVHGSGFNDSYDHKAGSGGADMTDQGQWSGSASGSQDGESAVVAGDQVIVHVDPDYELRVIYQDRRRDATATLSEDVGPEA